MRGGLLGGAEDGLSARRGLSLPKQAENFTPEGTREAVGQVIVLLQDNDR